MTPRGRYGFPRVSRPRQSAESFLAEATDAVKAVRKAKRRVLEDHLAAQIRRFHLPEPVREYQFYEGRKWRADFAWVEQKLLVEVEGITPGGGRHQHIGGFKNDLEKYNAATVDGWRLLRFHRGQIEDWSAVRLLARLLAEAGGLPGSCG
jgi:very-short-patch-repair endonuclease